MATTSIEIVAGDRIDLIANRTLGDSYRYDEMLKLNPYLDIWDPKPGQILSVPDVKQGT